MNKEKKHDKRIVSYDKAAELAKGKRRAIWLPADIVQPLIDTAKAEGRAVNNLIIRAARLYIDEAVRYGIIKNSVSYRKAGGGVGRLRMKGRRRIRAGRKAAHH